MLQIEDNAARFGLTDVADCPDLRFKVHPIWIIVALNQKKLSLLRLSMLEVNSQRLEAADNQMNRQGQVVVGNRVISLLDHLGQNFDIDTAKLDLD